MSLLQVIGPLSCSALEKTVRCSLDIFLLMFTVPWLRFGCMQFPLIMDYICLHGAKENCAMGRRRCAGGDAISMDGNFTDSFEWMELGWPWGRSSPLSSRTTRTSLRPQSLCPSASHTVLWQLTLLTQVKSIARARPVFTSQGCYNFTAYTAKVYCFTVLEAESAIKADSLQGLCAWLQGDGLFCVFPCLR